MVSKTSTSIAMFLTLNFMYSFTVTGVCDECTAPGPSSNISPLPPPNPTEVMCPSELSVCADWVQGLVNIVIGIPPVATCCSLVEGLDDLDAAVCLCATIRANVVGMNLFDIPLSLALLLNACSRNVPLGFVCALE